MGISIENRMVKVISAHGHAWALLGKDFARLESRAEFEMALYRLGKRGLFDGVFVVNMIFLSTNFWGDPWRSVTWVTGIIIDSIIL